MAAPSHFFFPKVFLRLPRPNQTVLSELAKREDNKKLVQPIRQGDQNEQMLTLGVFYYRCSAHFSMVNVKPF
jgi:hypothetical protein